MRRAKKFLLNAGILTLTSLLLRGVGVSFSVYIAAKIGPEGMGLYQLLQSVYLLAVTLASAGIGLAATRLVAEELAVRSDSGVLAAVRRCLCYSAVFGVLSALLLSAAAPWISVNWLHEKVSALTVRALAVSLPFLSTSAVLGGYFTAVRRVAKSSSAQIFEQFIRISVTVGALELLTPPGLDNACLTLVLGGVLAEAASFLWLGTLYLWDKRRYRRRTSVDPALTARMLGVSLPVALSSCIRSALNTYKQVIIPRGLERSGLSCELALAQYGMIRGMVMPVLLFPSALLSAFGSLLIPEITEYAVKGQQDRIRDLLSRIFKVTLLFSVGVSGILLCYAREICAVIYPQVDCAFFLAVFAPLVVMMYLDDIVDAVLKGLGEQVSVVYINIVDTLTCILLLEVLLPRFGIGGYVAVIFVSELLNGALSIGRLQKVSGFRLDLLRWVIFPALTMAGTLAAVRLLVPGNLPLAVLFSAAIYLLALWAQGGITREDVRV